MYIVLCNFFFQCGLDSIYIKDHTSDLEKSETVRTDPD